MMPGFRSVTYWFRCCTRYTKVPLQGRSICYPNTGVSIPKGGCITWPPQFCRFSNLFFDFTFRHHLGVLVAFGTTTPLSQSPFIWLRIVRAVLYVSLQKHIHTHFNHLHHERHKNLNSPEGLKGLAKMDCGDFDGIIRARLTWLC